jgi:hypothetical protein
MEFAVFQGVPHLIYVEGASPRKGDATFDAGWGALATTVSNAALVVAEIMPTPPYADWLKVGLYLYLIF